MSGRDVYVVRKTREIPEGHQPRIPTALDPYDFPYDGEPFRKSRSVRERDSSSTVDSVGAVSTSRSTKSTYTSDDRRRFEDTHADVDRSRYRDRSRPRTIKDSTGDSASRYQQTVILDENDDDRFSRRSSNYVRSPPAQRSKDRLDVNYDRPANRSREYIIDDSVNRSQGSLRREGKPHVIDTQGKVDIIIPGRHEERSNGRGPRYVYEGQPPRGRMYHDDRSYKESETDSSGVVLVRRNVTPPSRYQKSQPDQRRDIDVRQSRREYDKDDDWRIVDSMRDTHLVSVGAPGQTRSRAPTQSSEDSFVMVSPTQDSRQTVRSAIRRTDYAPAEQTRRRSRSISFRESQIVSHDAGDRRHERPGAEADICGPYLKRRSDRDSEIDADEYESVRGPRRTRRSEADGHSGEDRYREPYSPQVFAAPGRRERSRRRRDDEDDGSYYSERVDKRYTKETRYV